MIPTRTTLEPEERNETETLSLAPRAMLKHTHTNDDQESKLLSLSLAGFAAKSCANILFYTMCTFSLCYCFISFIFFSSSKWEHFGSLFAFSRAQMLCCMCVVSQFSIVWTTKHAKLLHSPPSFSLSLANRIIYCHSAVKYDVPGLVWTEQDKSFLKLFGRPRQGNCWLHLFYKSASRWMCVVKSAVTISKGKGKDSSNHAS